MKRKEAAAFAPNAPLLKSVARLPKIEHGGMHDKTVRTFSHNGHEISIATKYEIKIDGRVVHLPLMVSQDGQVQSHAIPNYSLSSAVDIVKTIIDLFTQTPERPVSPRQQRARIAQIPSPRRQTVLDIFQCPDSQRYDRCRGHLRLRHGRGCPLAHLMD
jgi:hypothetical protein